MKKAIEAMFLDDVILLRHNKEINLKFPDSVTQFRDLSDGYQSIIALITDIMMVLKKRWRNQDAEGVVLIDELDAHLHPSWNIEIVKRLKKTFPKLQFIVTSHNPLTLRGLIEGEIAVLKRNDEGLINVIQNLPVQNGLNVEELLTSNFFGLNDTLPELNRLFDKYYYLLSKSNPSNDDQMQIESLKNQLKKYNKTGTTEREQKFYEFTDYYIASEKNKNNDTTVTDFKSYIENAINYLKR